MIRFATCDLRFAIVALMSVSLAGCLSDGSQTSTTPPPTSAEPATTQPSYWIDQPVTATVSGSDFDGMVAACEAISRDYLFKIDRVDYRAGLVITQPMVSSQWFEPWRRDNHSLYDVEESSLAAIRRTIRFEFTRQGNDAWQVSPKIIVERQTIIEHRITSAVLVRSAFVTQRGADRQRGSREADQGMVIPQRYWTPIRRDTEFERVIAADLAKRLGTSAEVR